MKNLSIEKVNIDQKDLLVKDLDKSDAEIMRQIRMNYLLLLLLLLLLLFY